MRKWSHLLLGRPFKLITDQNSVAFMFDNRKRGKAKNEKIMRWRIELAQYTFDIIYRQGKLNAAPDALSRAYCATTTSNELYRIHAALWHPGVSRLHHFVKVKKLPYSLDDVKRVTANCAICCEMKPRFVNNTGSAMIKSTQPYERLSVDFKGPLPYSSRNHYFLTIIDEYSRFPFLFPCTDTSTQTVISHLKYLFNLFGFPAIIHCDNAECFVSKEITQFLHDRGIAITHSSEYN